jgi:peroxiredoxin
MHTKLITFLVVCSLLSVGTYLLTQPSYPELHDGLQFQRINGAQQTLSEIRGKPLMVVFWSPSCVICMQEVNQLNQLYRDFQGGHHFQLLAISMPYDRPDQVIQTSTRMGMNYPVYFDLKKEISRAFGNIVATPTLFLLNSQGKISYRHSGRSDFELIGKKLKKLIG